MPKEHLGDAISPTINYTGTVHYGRRRVVLPGLSGLSGYHEWLPACPPPVVLEASTTLHNSQNDHNAGSLSPSITSFQTAGWFVGKLHSVCELVLCHSEGFCGDTSYVPTSGHHFSVLRTPIVC